MKTIVCLSLSWVLFFSSCSKEGPQGPMGLQGKQGPAGPQGPAGQDGNASVIQFSYNGFTLGGSSKIDLPVDESKLEKSLVYVYVKYTGFWYPLPGYVGNNSYKIYFYPQPTVSSLFIRRITGSSDVGISAMRVIVVEANEVADARLLSSSLDYSNYRAVCIYYGIAE